MAAVKSLEGSSQRIQVARVRRAETAARRNDLRGENSNTVPSIAELDNLLEREPSVGQGTALEAVQSEASGGGNPSDRLLSRCYREMEERLLTVYDIWKCKTLRRQVTCTKEKKQWAPTFTRSRTRLKLSREPMV